MPTRKYGLNDEHEILELSGKKLRNRKKREEKKTRANRN